jgi:hypothetical protein
MGREPSAGVLLQTKMIFNINVGKLGKFALLTGRSLTSPATLRRMR